MSTLSDLLEVAAMGANDDGAIDGLERKTLEDLAKMLRERGVEQLEDLRKLLTPPSES